MTSRADTFEERVPGYRFGIVLVLLLTTFVFLSTSPSDKVARVVGTVLMGATLLAAMAASGVPRRLLRATTVIVLVAVGSTAISLFSDSSTTHGGALLLSALLVGVAPIVIVVSIIRRGVVDIHTILGAVCIYVMVGMFFSVVFTSIGSFEGDPFFAQITDATTADYLYFSYVTLTTVGYGDLSAAAGGIGRPMAAIEALIGQVYLVVVLALLVGQLGRRRFTD